MRQTVGFSVVLAVAVAAMRIASPVGGSLPPQLPVSKPGTVKPIAMKQINGKSEYRGGCSAYEVGRPERQYPRDSDQGAAKSVIDKFFGLDPDAQTSETLPGFTKVHYTIALVADPRHTNLSLMFDRQTALIQQAAQDEGYTYNSSWFPWSSESQVYPLLENQQYAEEIADHREACPGVLLFRRSLQRAQPAPAGPADPYSEAMVVLVVGEQPTGGLNEDQWANAVLWLKKNASPKEANQNSFNDQDVKRRILRILGPTFSGTLVSLDRDLKKIYAETETKDARADESFPGSNTPTRLLSGVVSGCSSIRWFQQRLVDNRFDRKVVFGSFNENDELGIYRFLSYMHNQGTDLQDVAILSEDETAYGTSPQKLANDGEPSRDRCEFPYDPEKRPVRLFYPRDISAIRNAYEKQSVFAAPNQAAHAIHPILQEGGAGEGGEASNSTDTLPVYSGMLTAIAQEAILYQIVSNLRVHHTRYLMLRCTNPLDYLFLTRFFHRAYPEGRIVTVGADILFRREIDTTEFRGVLALTTYPLLPRNQHWSWLSQRDGVPFSHAHRVFESNFEGSYIAARYLFGLQKDTEPEKGAGIDTPLVLPLKEDIPDYADPFWMQGSSVPMTQTRRTGPPTWLAVVGRDGYWPIAVLDENYTPALNAGNKPVSTTVQLKNEKAHYNDKRKDATKLNGRLLFGLPLPWSICAILSLLLLAYQTWGVWKGDDFASSGLFSLFRRVSTPTQSLLVGVNSGFAAALLLQLVAIVLGAPSADIHSSNLFEAGLYAIAGGAMICVMGFSVVAPFRRGIAVGWFCATLAVLGGASYAACWSGQEGANSLALFYRMGHLTSGVSPLVPVLFLLLGFYVWTWQAMAGNSLLCPGRPLLPKLAHVAAIGGIRKRYFDWIGVFTGATGEGAGHLEPPEYRISSEMEKRILEVASPLSVQVRFLLLPGVILVAALGYMFASGPPLLSLESHAYAVCINLTLLAAFLLITTEAGRLYFSWLELRRLLSALNRLRLRRTFSKLSAVSQGSLWSVSGGVQRIQYLFFSQQLDAAHRLNMMSNENSPSLRRAVECGRAFASRSATDIGKGPEWASAIDPPGNAGGGMVLVREEFNNAAANVIKELLEKWREERESLNFPERHSAGGESGETTFEMKLSEEPTVVAAEEFVCLHYIAFIQNILGRIRTMTLSMVSLFLTVCLAISFYPFVPRTQISAWMIINLALIGAVVVYVYAGMERDETLSHITNTTPGRLGPEFYLKTAGFLAGPVIGLLTTQFPSISESVLSWLQPGLDALK